MSKFLVRLFSEHFGMTSSAIPDILLAVIDGVQTAECPSVQVSWFVFPVTSQL
jgi:hypothetical protein